MTRKIYIGDTGSNVRSCLDSISRRSEERLNFQIIKVSDLIEQGLTNINDKDWLIYFVPYLNNYQGTALYVKSSFVPKFDVDMFFNFKTMNNRTEPVLYFSQHDAWLIDCSVPELKNLNPVTLNQSDITSLLNFFPITVINNI